MASNLVVLSNGAVVNLGRVSVFEKIHIQTSDLPYCIRFSFQEGKVYEDFADIESRDKEYNRLICASRAIKLRGVDGE